MKLRTLLAGAVISLPAMVLAQANIDNGTVRIGVRADGALMPSDVSPLTGITYLANGQDGLTPGCACEAWGIADAVSSSSGYTGAVVGTSAITQESFASTATTATSVVNAFGVFRITHAYAPSAATNNIYEVKVTIENISAAPAEALYGRAMDWDVYPTQFNEYTTIQRGNSTALVFSSDNGFHNADPLNQDSGRLFVNQDIVDSGPEDHGAHFRFNFGTIAPGAKFEFVIGYGVAGNQVDALAALGSFGAQAYSLGKPSLNEAGDPSTDGTPNTFIFAFKGIGGVQLIGVDAVDDTAPSLTRPTSGTVAAINVLTNDTVDAAAATPSNVAFTAVGAWPTGITVSADGNVLVGSTVTPGTYTLNYQICSTVQATQCDTATVTLNIESIGVEALDDAPPAVTRPNSGTITAINVLANDTFDGGPATTSNVVLTPVGTWPAGITVSPNGDVLVASTAATGSYTLAYEICSTALPTQCDTANVTLNVTAPAAVAPQAVPVDGPLALAGLGLLMLGFARRKFK